MLGLGFRYMLTVICLLLWYMLTVYSWLLCLLLGFRVDVSCFILRVMVDASYCIFKFVMLTEIACGIYSCSMMIKSYTEIGSFSV